MRASLWRSIRSLLCCRMRPSGLPWPTLRPWPRLACSIAASGSSSSRELSTNGGRREGSCRSRPALVAGGPRRGDSRWPCVPARGSAILLFGGGKIATTAVVGVGQGPWAWPSAGRGKYGGERFQRFLATRDPWGRWGTKPVRFRRSRWCVARRVPCPLGIFG